ncbi:MAG: hypothetical protein ACI9MC_000484 [Kiritimatiellia bacterium]
MAIIQRVEVVRALLRALKTRNFLILAGLSGTGKTQLARYIARAVANIEEVWGPGEGLDKLLAKLDKTVAEGTSCNEFEPVEGYPGWIAVKDPGASITDGESGTTYLKRVGFLAVRPDWTDAKKIWGYYNPLTGHFYPTDALVVALNAYRDYLDRGDGAHRHYVILDEMNLARVEYYLSDLLSLMESGCREVPDDPKQVMIGETAMVHPLDSMIVSRGRRGIRHDNNAAQEGAMDQVVPLYEMDVRRWIYSPLVEGLRVATRPDTEWDPAADYRDVIAAVFPIPPRIAYTPNMTLIGTINIDETTHGFAPKVLDRAFILEFDEVDYEAALGRHPAFDETRDLLDGLHDALSPAGRHFGYRVAQEMLDYVQGAGGVLDHEVGDFLVMGKVLPKLRGTEPELAQPVASLLALMQRFGYERSSKKLIRMQTQLKNSGFGSFFT